MRSTTGADYRSLENDKIKDETMIWESKQQCIQSGIDPNLPPVFHTRFSEVELKAQLHKYSELLDIISIFVNKLLSTMQGDPILILVTDNEGYILTFKGDPASIARVQGSGVIEGVQFSEEVGTSSIELSLRYKQPIQLLGEDHFHTMLQRSACYSAPIHSDGERRIIGTLNLMTDIEFAHPHFLALLSAVTDSVEREMMLQKQNNQQHILNQALLETNYYGLIVTDALGRIIEINEKCLTILQLEDRDKREFIHSSVFDMIAIGQYFHRVIDEHKACVGMELSLQVQGSIQYYILDVVPIYDCIQTLIRVVGSFHNITEMKKTEEMLRNTEKLIFAGEVAVSIAHEIRNPLATVKGLIQISGKDSKLLHYDLIMSELERMNLITRDFMILGKPQMVQFQADYCHTILEEVLSIFNIQAGMNDISIVYEIIQDIQIQCDRNQIKQVFLNILSNAKEALPCGGEIRISLEIEGDFQRVRIRDNGEGMTDEVLQKIGEPFHTTKQDGNGLGMTIVYKILTSHGGHLDITSDVGVGTTVDIYFPLKDESSSNSYVI
ncbi:ATP-binding protein [Paenibacillus sp. FA6]|uniref:ATP-binding protein n=1 Tax=Paenibacillus sp. FA6 TaxID=3413029 RepID=UPI003F6596A6